MSPYESERSNEDEFFRREDQRLIEKLKALKAAESARDALSTALKITNPAVLDKLMELEIGPEIAAALAVVPLAEVAWADGTLDAKERQAVLTSAAESGFASGSAEHALLETWLEKRPEPRIFEAWKHLIEGMCEKLTPDEIGKLKTSLIERARRVASASGGVLGMGSKVSKAEASMLSKLEKAFDRS